MKKYQILPMGLLLASTAVFAAGQHAGMDHSEMDHSKMVSSTIDHSNMQHHGQMASAVGMPAPVEQATKTFEVSLTDDMKMHFSPALNIKQGEIVRFVISNNGKMPHEFSVGSLDEQDKHRAMMRSMPDMVHSDGSTITLQAGENAELGWHFMGTSFVEFSCNIPGHAEAGMKMNTILR
ncbi:cupredoxin family protein [Photobacterium sp. SDRW27]|uniref:cupredoxin domain-containing protein n=1 Tax=Photobacterium obscurum TaxID=2829490 RepID=UPI002242E6E2|nr:cupredoxin family protein [Photobacterium obscurum]MCW8327607.1 cupredoxin family protein [Photobacterium obscurum]